MPEIMKHEIILKNRKLKCEWTTNQGKKMDFKILFKMSREKSLKI